MGLQLLDLPLRFADFTSEAFRFRSSFHLGYLAPFNPLKQEPGLLLKNSHAFTQGGDLRTAVPLE